MKRLVIVWTLGFCLAIAVRAIGVGESGSIRAVARVVPLMGLTEIDSVPAVLAEVEKTPQTGSHLFWLYYPWPSGVQVEVDGAGGTQLTADGNEADRSGSGRLRFLSRYRYASVLEWDAAGRAAGSDAPVTITVVFTDN